MWRNLSCLFRPIIFKSVWTKCHDVINSYTDFISRCHYVRVNFFKSLFMVQKRSRVLAAFVHELIVPTRKNKPIVGKMQNGLFSTLTNGGVRRSSAVTSTFKRWRYLPNYKTGVPWEHPKLSRRMWEDIHHLSRTILDHFWHFYLSKFNTNWDFRTILDHKRFTNTSI